MAGRGTAEEVPVGGVGAGNLGDDTGVVVIGAPGAEAACGGDPIGAGAVWAAIESTEGGMDSMAWMQPDKCDNKRADVWVSTSAGFCWDMNFDTSCAH